MRLATLRVIYVGIPVCIAWFGMFGDRGYLDLLKMRAEIRRQAGFVENIRQENRTIEAEVVRLKEDSRYLEESVRKVLGLAQEDDIVYEFE
jgi:cell division protein FtsB